jgi:hypothetical protein
MVSIGKICKKEDQAFLCPSRQEHWGCVSILRVSRLRNRSNGDQSKFRPIFGLVIAIDYTIYIKLPLQYQ